MSVVLIAAASSTLFLTVEAESQDWDVNDDGNCNLLDISQISYHASSNDLSCDVNNDGSVDQHDVQLMESHCDWQSGSANAGSFGATAVYVDPSSQTVPVGESFTIDIYCTPGEPIRAFQFDLGFDEDILHADSVTNVGKIFTDAGREIFSGDGTIDNSAGNITLIYAAVKGKYYVSDSGKFATIEFTVESEAESSNLDLCNVKVTNKTDYIPVTVSDGTVTTGSFCVDAGGPYNGEPGEPIQFTGSVVSGGTPPYNWNWDFGDGGTSTEQNPVHTYSGKDVYSVTLTVEDDNGETSTASTTATTITGGDTDLECDGSLSWSDVKPGATVTGSFTVSNAGDPKTLLNWEVSEHPDWGTWSITPNNGIELKPEDESVEVIVEVEVPDKQNWNFDGQVKIVNSDDSSDYETIQVSLSTPKNKGFDVFPLFLRFLEQHPMMFPMLRLILELQ
jgi:PKD repeat protein